MRPKHLSGFTMFEIIFVFVIVSVLAGFGVPRYLDAMEKARQRDARAMLFLIRNAQEIYLNKKKAYCPSSGAATISQINQDLYLDILQPTGISYECTANAGIDFSCAAKNNHWEIAITKNTGPTCTALTGGKCFTF